MKSRTSIVFVVLAMVLLFGVYHEFGGAASSKKEFLPARIGVVSVQKVLLEGDKNKSWDTIIQAEGARMKAELMQIRSEIVAGEEKLKTSLFALNKVVDAYGLDEQAVHFDELFEHVAADDMGPRRMNGNVGVG